MESPRRRRFPEALRIAGSEYVAVSKQINSHAVQVCAHKQYPFGITQMRIVLGFRCVEFSLHKPDQVANRSVRLRRAPKR